jgi:recombination protein RecT
MTTTNAVATQDAPPKLLAQLEARQDQFGRALAGRIDPDAFIRVAYATITKTPKLAKCTPASIMMALMEAASLGLTVNGVMGEAYLVPFNHNIGSKAQPNWEARAQFMPGARGLVKLSRQSGVIRTIVPRVVRHGDLFEVELGERDTLRHVPDLSGDESRPVAFVYAVAHFTDRVTTQFEYMNRMEVERVRARSKSKDDGPWITDWEEMALKTVVRRLCKRLPLSDFDLARALEADNKDYDLSLPVQGQVASGAQGLMARLQAASGETAATEDVAEATWEHVEDADQTDILAEDAVPPEGTTISRRGAK